MQTKGTSLTGECPLLLLSKLFMFDKTSSMSTEVVKGINIHTKK
jgi:hypothetical protein